MSPRPVLEPSLTDEANSDLKTAQGVGSDTWMGADVYEPDDRLYIETTKFFHTVKWDVLADIASKHRRGIGCRFSGKFSVGQSNIWSDDLPLRMVSTRLPGQRAFETEAAAMLYFRTKTNIPTPELFRYDSDPANPAGVPYMLMEYIHSTVAEELRQMKRCAPSLFGTPEQDQRFRKQMATIQAQTMSCQFSKIGSLYYDEKTSFYVGPDLETGRGPWTSSTGYYRDLAEHYLKLAATCSSAARRLSFTLPLLLEYLLRVLGEEGSGPFRLVNRDFGAHNILVDENFSIVGVVDFDSVMAAPVEVVAQYPDLSGMDVQPPGHIETSALALERIKAEEPRLVEYKEWLTKFELERLKSLGSGLTPAASRLRSIPALLFNGMVRYGALSGIENDQWFKAASEILRAHVTAKQ